MATQIERRRTERGILLRLLVANDAEWMAFRALWRLMDRSGFPLSLNALEFHLRYMQGRGYVEVSRVRDMEAQELLEGDGSLSPDQILFVKLAPDGLSILNRSVEDLEMAV